MGRRDALATTQIQPEASTNLALWLDRYSWGFDQEVAKAHVTSTLSTVRVPEGYKEAFERRKRMLQSLTGGYADGTTRLYTITLSGRAILGIGMASVRETNLSLLRPWGLPYLAGSSLKGLASHTAHFSGGPDWARPVNAGEDAGALQRALFGDVTSAGAVVFHDAWWMPLGERPPVHADTMTVHHADYYSGNGAPTDWQEPNPVSFLTISGSYLLALSGPAEALDLIEKILEEGLKTHGIGAKTAAGYGRAKLERLTSAFVRKMDGYQRPAAQPNNVEHQTREFLEAIKDASSGEEIEAAERAARRMVEASPKVWREWLARERCPEEARRWFKIQQQAATSTTPAAVAPTSTPAPVAAVAAEEQAGMGWIALDKSKRPTLYVLLEGNKKPLEEELRKLKQAPDEATRAALEAATADAPVAVQVETKSSKRLLAVRLRG